ncbi:response regulator transcription factor [Stenotrophomonas maltophilia]|uniref:response regulator transcription factor n=1 Tax=Stenotrophomonas maltophilia TaxID=40324 RepID=UPI003D7E9EBD
MTNPAPSCSVVLLDDHEVVRYGVALHLAPLADMTLLGHVGTSFELLSLLAGAPACVIVMDYVLGPTDINGGALIALVRQRHPTCKVLVLSAHPGAEHLAMAAGAHGFVHKARPVVDLIRSIRRLYARRDCALPGAGTPDTRCAACAARDAVAARRMDHPALTSREREVLQLWLQGATLREIAQALGTRTNTISTQKRSAMRKLGISNDNELLMAQWLSGSE